MSQTYGSDLSLLHDGGRRGRDRIRHDDDDLLGGITRAGCIVVDNGRLAMTAGTLLVGNIVGTGHDGHEGSIGEAVTGIISLASLALARRGRQLAFSTAILSRFATFASTGGTTRVVHDKIGIVEGSVLRQIVAAHAGAVNITVDIGSVVSDLVAVDAIRTGTSSDGIIF